MTIVDPNTDITTWMGPMVARRVPEGFPTTPYRILEIEPLAPTIGARVRGVQLADDHSEEVMIELRRALLEWKVLFFPGQDLTQDAHRDFAVRWGDIEVHPFFQYVNPGQRGDHVVNLAKDDKTGGYENHWHHDVTWRPRPSFGAVLRAVEIPEVGGDTCWADAGAAYDLLPDDLKARIEGLEAVHDWRQSFGTKMPADAVEKLAVEHPPAVHPVVRVHPETGRRTLFVNRVFTQHIVGMDRADSDALLARLIAQYDRPEIQVRYRWSAGDVAFWDNRATLHYAISDYHPNRRVMERISIVGDVPTGV